jgi:dienelactone hydrolase
MARDMRWLVVVCVATLFAAGCVTHVPLSPVYQGPDDMPVAIIEELPLVAIAPLVVRAEQVVRNRPHFNVRRILLPSTVDAQSSIEFEYYDMDGNERTPVVVLLPIFNGQLIVTRYFARYFANQGWRALVLTREHDPLEQLDQAEAAIRANLAEYQRVLDWVELQPDVDPSRIGLFGISFGAMDAVMLTAVDDRVDALVAAMGGGDLAQLLMSTNYRRVTRMLERQLDDTGASRKSIAEALEARIAIDPLTLAPYVDAERVLMIMTRTDAIVPFEAQQALWSSMGSPETLYLPTGHRPAVLFFPKVRSTAFEFFERQFRPQSIAAAR